MPKVSSGYRPRGRGLGYEQRPFYFKRRRIDMKKISVWYDKEVGLLEVLFKKKIGYFRATKNEAIMERVDQNGNVIGFMIEINKKILKYN